MVISLKVINFDFGIDEIQKEIDGTEKEVRNKIVNFSINEAPMLFQDSINAHISSQNLINVSASKMGTYINFYVDNELFLWLSKGTSEHSEMASGFGGIKKYSEVKANMQYYNNRVTYKSNFPRALTIKDNNGNVRLFSPYVFHKGAKIQEWFISDIENGVNKIESALRAL